MENKSKKNVFINGITLSNGTEHKAVIGDTVIDGENCHHLCYMCTIKHLCHPENELSSFTEEVVHTQKDKSGAIISQAVYPCDYITINLQKKDPQSLAMYFQRTK